MSRHSQRTIAKNPNPTTYTRELFEVAHMSFMVIDHPKRARRSAFAPSCTLTSHRFSPALSRRAWEPHCANWRTAWMNWRPRYDP